MRASSVFALVAAATAFLAAVRAPHSTDLFWQIPEGRAVLRGAIPRDVPWAIGDPRWFDHEWLFEALAAWCWDHHAFIVLVLLCAAGAAAAPLLAYAISRDLKYDWATTSFIVLLVCAATSVAVSERPQTFVLLAFLGMLWLLWRGAARPLAIFALACAWSNLHASGVLAPFLCLMFAAGYAIEGGVGDIRVRRALIATAAALIATFVTPNGIGLWAYSITSMTDANHSHRYIVEWLPLADGEVAKAAWLWALIVVAVLARTVFLRREGFAASAVGAVFLALPALHARFILFAPAAAMPLIARSIGGIAASSPSNTERVLPGAVIALPALLLAAGVWLAVRGPTLGADPAFADAATLLVRNHVSGGIYAQYTAAAYFAAFEALPVQVMIDAHGDPFDAATWDDENVIEHAAAGWDAALERHSLRAAVLPDGHPLIAVMKTSPRWTAVESTANATLFAFRAPRSVRRLTQ